MVFPICTVLQVLPEDFGLSESKIPAADIKLAFPDTKGYSVRNLKYMEKFASAYEDEEFVQMMSAQIPWSQN